MRLNGWPLPRTAGVERDHIIFVCLVFHPDTSASSILFTDLFVHLAQEEMRVTVLTGFPSKDGKDEVMALPREDLFRGVRIVRCGLRVAGKRSIVLRALSYGSFLLHAGWKLLGMGRRATVVGGTDPPFTSIALWALSWIGRFRYQTILLDVYPDGFVGIGSLREGALLTRVWRALNRRSFQQSERLIVIGRDMVTLLERRYGIDRRHITYIPHWGTIEVDVIENRRSSDLLTSLHIENKFVVQYSGNMGLWHDMDPLVRAAALLRNETHIHFLFIGKGRRRAAAEALSHTLGLTNITWLDFMPRERLHETLTSCDVSLISLRSGLEGVAVPSKLYGILATGRAIVAQVPRESEVAYVLQEERCGLAVDPDDVEGLAVAIRMLADQPELAQQMGANAQAAYRSKYTIDHALTAFTRLWSIP